MNNQTLSTEIPPFEQLVVGGGDDRLDLLTSGKNKYNVDPNDFRGVLNRASCTCSPFTPLGYEAARALYERLSPEVFDEVRGEHTRKIKNLINYASHDRFHVFYAPSGSDLCYYPLMFSRLIHPDKDIFNVITCPEELGSGSLAAYNGKSFFNRNQFGEVIEKGEPLSDDLTIKSETFPARSKDGTIVNHWHKIIDVIHDNYLDYSVNANLVIGSKSGIENNVAVISQAPEDVLWTVDLCQFRASRVLINGLIGMNCCAMLTGSKFYQSPPFCAAILVPKTICERFNGDYSVVRPFAKVFSACDIPPEFPQIQDELIRFRNYGLLLRWEAALAEMLATAELDTYEVNRAIDSWSEQMVEAIGQRECFQLMPGQDETNKTIVSFRIRKNETEFLSHEELTQLYRNVCAGKYAVAEGVNRVLFGQPVRYGDRSFVRIALGSSDVREFTTHGIDFARDLRLVEIIEQAVAKQQWK